MSAPLDLIPEDAKLLGDDGKIGRRWYLWLFVIWSRLRSCVAIQGSVYTKSSQSASIVTATIATIVYTGWYRPSYYIRVTTIPTTSFSLTVTLGWRDGGVTKSQAFAALTGAPGTLATAFQTDAIAVKVDSGTVMTISVAYVSVGATAAVFAVDAPVEFIS